MTAKASQVIMLMPDGSATQCSLIPARAWVMRASRSEPVDEKLVEPAGTRRV